MSALMTFNNNWVLAVQNGLLTGGDFRNVWAENSNFNHAKLSNANFSGSRLAHSTFDYCNAENCDFSICDLCNVSFKNSNLYKSQFIESAMVFTSFKHSVLHGVDFDRSKMDNVCLIDAIGNGDDIITLQLDGWAVVYCRKTKHLAIGCTQMPYAMWVSYGFDEYKALSKRGGSWSKKWKEHLTTTLTMIDPSLLEVKNVSKVEG